MTKSEREIIQKKAVRDFKRGDRIVDIAIRYGRTPGTITQWAKKGGAKLRQQGCRLKLVPNAFDIEILEQVRNRVNGKPSFTKIGAPYQMERQQIYRIYQRWKDWDEKNVKPPFESGDKIRFDGRDFTVVKAGVLSGTVKDKTGHLIHKFFWNHNGQHAVKL